MADELLKPAVVFDEDQEAAAANKASALAAISASQIAVKGGALELHQDIGAPAVRSKYLCRYIRTLVRRQSGPSTSASMLLGSTHIAQLFAVAGACLVLVLWRLRSRRKQLGKVVILQPALAATDQ